MYLNCSRRFDRGVTHWAFDVVAASVVPVEIGDGDRGTAAARALNACVQVIPMGQFVSFQRDEFRIRLATRWADFVRERFGAGKAKQVCLASRKNNWFFVRENCFQVYGTGDQGGRFVVGCCVRGAAVVGSLRPSVG